MSAALSLASGGLHIAWARLFIRALVASGVKRAVVSPGSRSTPLVLAIAEEPELVTEVIVDERSAAFFALGQARATGEPTLLVCTSGTAGAHYLPAIVEASESEIPLVVLTADRPWEAYDARSAQTIDQVKLYGDHVRHYAELGLPDPAPAALHAVVRIAAQAVHHTRPPGPVHVNARFRAPLEPVDTMLPEEVVRDVLAAAAPKVCRPRIGASDEGARLIADLVSRATSGVVVCGPAPVSARHGRAALRVFLERSGFALFAEATSQMRFGLDAPLALDRFDGALRDPSFRRSFVPDLVIEVGRPAVSSGWSAWVAEHRNVDRIVIDPSGWSDPHGGVRATIFAEPYATLERAAEHLARREPAADFRRRIEDASEHAAMPIDGPLSGRDVARVVVDALPSGGALLVGNSSPIRDLDTFAPVRTKPIAVHHQRGASGIDGLLAGAAGARTVVNAPVLALVGDVSFAHDIGSLSLLARMRGPLCIVVVNNGGGRIFDALPISKRPEVAPYFERFFATPQAIEIVDVAGAFGVEAVRVDTESALRAEVDRALASTRCHVIEVLVGRGRR